MADGTAVEGMATVVVMVDEERVRAASVADAASEAAGRAAKAAAAAAFSAVARAAEAAADSALYVAIVFRTLAMVSAEK